MTPSTPVSIKRKALNLDTPKEPLSRNQKKKLSKAAKLQDRVPSNLFDNSPLGQLREAESEETSETANEDTLRNHQNTPNEQIQTQHHEQQLSGGTNQTLLKLLTALTSQVQSLQNNNQKPDKTANTSDSSTSNDRYHLNRHIALRAHSDMPRLNPEQTNKILHVINFFRKAEELSKCGDYHNSVTICASLTEDQDLKEAAQALGTNKIELAEWHAFCASNITRWTKLSYKPPHHILAKAISEVSPRQADQPISKFFAQWANYNRDLIWLDSLFKRSTSDLEERELTTIMITKLNDKRRTDLARVFSLSNIKTLTIEMVRDFIEGYNGLSKEDESTTNNREHEHLHAITQEPHPPSTPAPSSSTQRGNEDLKYEFDRFPKTTRPPNRQG
jgi:hypothetical protein